jgi:hypothetical protein
MTKDRVVTARDEVRALNDAELEAVSGGTSSFIIAVANAALKALGKEPLTKKGDPDLPGLGGLPPY